MWPHSGFAPQGADMAAVCGLDDPMRRSLYDYVASCGQPVGKDAAAQAVGIGRSLAAYHLDKLVEVGLLTASYQRPAGRRGPGAGRPAKVYARSGQEFTVSVPRRDYELAARLLAQAVTADPSSDARAELWRAARELGEALGHHHQPGTAARPDRLDELEAELQRHGFEPCRDEDSSINLANCPFHQLAEQYPEVICGMNLALIDGLIKSVANGEEKAGAHAALAPQPGRCCVVIRTDPIEPTAAPGVS
jgi:predicted ArsR family transcriptional regulator